MARSAPVGMNRFYVALAAIAALGVGGLGFLVSRSGTVSIPANVAVTAADTAGFRGYQLGSADAPVEITEYADYQCPACRDFETVQFPDVRDRLIGAGRVRWRYRDFPLQMHQHARLASHAAACADEQGKFWEVHRVIYEGQSDWAAMRDAGGELRGYAKAAGVDLGRYDDCMKSTKYAGRIQASLDEGIKLGVGSTPTFLIGGRLYPGALPYDVMRHIVDSIAPRQAKPDSAKG
jgi:protein-disulfide isomerase